MRPVTVSGDRGAGEADDANAGTGWAVPRGGGRDGGGAAGGGPAAEGGVGGATILPAIITPGAAESLSKGYYGVPKRDLVTGLQVLLQRGALQIAAGLKHAAELVEELAGMRVKVGSEGREPSF